MLLHATCVAVRDHGVLLTGAPGSGKSDLALRLIADGAALVADDQVELWERDGRLLASPPAAIQGMIEVRHVGLLRVPFCEAVAVALAVDLAPVEQALERLPEPDAVVWLGVTVPRLTLPAFAASTPAKIVAALSYERVSES